MANTKTPRATSIKTVNQKIRRLARKYGTSNLEYQKYISDIERNFKYHYTADGIVQIEKPANMSQYQAQVIKKLGGRKGVKALETAAKKRLQDEGIKKPTSEQIQQEVTKFSERQKSIDDTLDLIYIEVGEGSLPSDLAAIYDKMHRRGKGSGAGVSNSELDKLIEGVAEWQDVKEQIQDISTELRNDYYMPHGFESEVWDSMSGRKTLQESKELLKQLQEYLDDMTADSEV